VWFQNRCGDHIFSHHLQTQFIFRRAREKSQACKYTLTKHATENWPNSNGGQSTVTSSSPPSAANWPNFNGAQSTVTSSSPSSAPAPTRLTRLSSPTAPFSIVLKANPVTLALHHVHYHTPDWVQKLQIWVWVWRMYRPSVTGHCLSQIHPHRESNTSPWIP
jgi:hypothetical protein